MAFIVRECPKRGQTPSGQVKSLEKVVEGKGSDPFLDTLREFL
jgi:hypothetical protein